jgi:hypothetical protein
MMKPIDIVFLTIGGSCMFVGLFILWPLFILGLAMVTWALVSHFGGNGGSGPPHGGAGGSQGPYGPGNGYPCSCHGLSPYGSQQPLQSYPEPHQPYPPVQDQRCAVPGQSLL